MSHEQSSKFSSNGSEPAGQPEPEVVPKAVRRSFSAAYKLRIVEEADQCTERGQIGALLRREGLYSSQLATWRRLRGEGGLPGLCGACASGLRYRLPGNFIPLPRRLD